MRQKLLIEIPARTIKQLVQDRLQDFAHYQRQREERRKRYNEAERARRAQPVIPRQRLFPQSKTEAPDVRNIKVTYRAVFEQPIGVEINPMGLKIAGPMPFEVFEAAGKWRIRGIAGPNPVVYGRLGTFVSAEHAKACIATKHQRQLQPWTMWAIPPRTMQEVIENEPYRKQPQQIDPGQVRIEDTGAVRWLTPDDYTHILHAPSIPVDSRTPPAACGAKVDSKSFINNRANVEPTCKACAAVWRAHYRAESFA